VPLPIQQLKGNMKLGVITADIDVSDNVTKMIIHRVRESITVPATLGTGEAGQAAGALSGTLEIDYFSSMAADSLWDQLYTAMETDTSELFFSGTFDPAPASADNPTWTGRIVVLAVDTGGTVGGLRTYSSTFPIVAGSLIKAIA